MNVRHRCLWSLILPCCLLLAALGPTSGRTAETLPPYQLYVVLSITGQGAFLGQSQADTLRALQDYVNQHGGIDGRQLRFEIVDNESKPELSVQLANQIIAKHPAVFIMSGLIAACLATQPLVRDGPVEFCLSPGLYPAPGTYAFSIAASTADMITTLVRYARERGWTRIAAITSTDASGQDADEKLHDALSSPENKSLTLVEAEHFKPSDLSVSAQVARIKFASPQLLIAWTSGTTFATVLRGVKDAGLDVPIMTTTGNMNVAQMRQYANILPSELYFPGLAYLARRGTTKRQDTVVRDFYDALAKVNVRPDFSSGIIWDPVMIAVDALRRIGPNATAQQVRDYIANLHGFVGISGTYDFRAFPQRGLGQKDVMVMRWSPMLLVWNPVSKYGGEPIRQKGSQ